jgi:short-subunit dehydrogenase
MSEQQRQVVCVTGASAGLGRAIVQRFAREGAHVAILSRDGARLVTAARQIEAVRGRKLLVQP